MVDVLHKDRLVYQHIAQAGVLAAAKMTAVAKQQPTTTTQIQYMLLYCRFNIIKGGLNMHY